MNETTTSEGPSSTEDPTDTPPDSSDMTPDPGPVGVCDICMESKPLISLRLCNHRFCADCVVNFVKLLSNEGHTEIPCPSSECSGFIHPKDIEDFLMDTPNLLRKWETFGVRKALLSDPDVRWCPGSNCSFAISIPDSTDCPKLVCESPNCGQEFCYICGRPWHPDSCRGPDIINLDASHKQCPHCYAIIEKCGGCNEMRCRICGQKFCWICGRVNPGAFHYVGQDTCPFWTLDEAAKQTRTRRWVSLTATWLLAIPVGFLASALAALAFGCGIPPMIAFRLYQQEAKRNYILRVLLTLFALTFCYVFILPLCFLLGIALFVAIIFYAYFWVPLSLCARLEFMDHVIPTYLNHEDELTEVTVE